MPKKEAPSKLLEQPSYDADELKQLYDIDKDRFRSWINNGPLNVLYRSLSYLDVPIYPNESSLSKLSNSVGSCIKLIELEQLQLSASLQKKAIVAITEYIPALSQMSFSIKDNKVDAYSIKVRGNIVESHNDKEGIFNTLRDVCRFDRSAKDYNTDPKTEEINPTIGRNKLARISLIASGQFLKLLNSMSGLQQDEVLNIIARGQVPPQLISDEELSRVETYNAWMKNNKEGEEPHKPARAIWIDSIRDQIGLDVINYREIAKKIENSYPDEVFMGGEDDRTHLYNMIDLTEETNDLKDIPQPNWDSGSTFSFV